VVLDLESDVEYTASQLSSPDRLIVEVHAIGNAHPGAVPAAPNITSTVPSASRPLRSTASPAPKQVLTAAMVTPAVTSSAPPPSHQLLDAAKTSPKQVLPTAVVIPAVASTTPSPARPLVDTAKVRPVVPSRDHELAVEEAKESPATPPVIAPTARVAQLDHNASLTRALGLKVNRIVIDAGHGGHDQGTTGPNGMLEKDLVLDVALRLGKLVEERMNAEVVYTRSDDTFVPLEERTAIANRSHADLFISIHANSSPAPEVVGVETYYLNFTNSAEAMNVAARENAVSDKSVFELKDLIQKISLHDKAEESKAFAAAVQASMQSYTIRYFPTARDRGVRKAPFVVLIGASMPSILAEIGFLTNSKQERLLSKPDFRQHLAEVLYRGIHNYTQTLSHFEEAKQTAETRSAGVAQ
jgi:N-acetylmuramoyl-L-alanine amidase